MDDVNSVIYGVLGGLVAVATTSIGVANWLNARFDAIKSRQLETDHRLAVELEQLRGIHALSRSGEISHWDMLEYKCNGNKELIEHRTTRFMSELSALETRLSRDIEEVKQFLAKTTEFHIRGDER